ncbi:uncharacterized protein J4E84_005052 [Alternaria hordeiaustralica]|uniref:uncharacterized protein n=1 Tax=Alternaria hordeiaustralica TaxID=1187925 RepID=UPI0020C311C8|nr:uncharacterized protein J4E84_005052 [Alternaria hordeiaustralica]KAI4688124.1 hypothetical protein J4E84_005052 [Alternaria hordeiaustralica]
MDVVLADGTQLHVTRTTHPELYYALRGAADSIGIVTTFYLQTQPAPAQIVSYSMNFTSALKSSTSVADVLLQLQKFAQSSPLMDRNITLEIYMNIFGAFEVRGWYFGDRTHFSSAVLPAMLEGLPKADNTTIATRSWLDALQDIAEGEPLVEPLTGYNNHQTFYTKSIVTREAKPLTRRALESFAGYVISKGLSAESPWETYISLYGGRDSQINVPSPDSAAYSHRDSLWVFQNIGSSANMLPPFESGIKAFVQGLNTALTDAQPDGDFLAYPNYLDPELTPAEAHRLYYGDATYGKLKQAALRPAPTGLDAEGTLQDAVRDLITSYHDLNPSTIDILTTEPSPLQFMRHVARNRPFVIRNGAKDFKARKAWNASYLKTAMQGQNVNVAITPHGNADSVVSLPSDGAIFVKPYETEEPFEDVLNKIQRQEQEADYSGPTRYAQTQNDNLRNEYSTLFADVPKSIPFARIALEQEPDAINFWLGNSYSTTALHKDNYENIYVQILGQKHFVLLPPVEAGCVNEKSVLAATYTPKREDGSAHSALEQDDLVIKVDEPEEYVPFATWDPDQPATNTTPYSQYSQPLRVTLEEGDMLYLPALWYHKVSQSCNEEGICCAVNYWYDLDFSGGFWSTANFVRSAGLLSMAEKTAVQTQEER